MANQFLALSLFIMMLSFFIILNAHSNFDVAKSQPVLNSLSTVFSQDEMIRPVTPPGQEESFEQSSRTGSVLTQIQSIFSAEISGVEARQNRLGTEMVMRLPLTELQTLVNQALSPQTPTTRGLRSDGEGFADMLVSLMNTDTLKPYRMDIVLGLGEDPVALAQTDAPAYNKAAQAITDITARLQTAGMPARFMSAGLDNGEAGVALLYFRRHQPFNPVDMKTKAGPR